MQKTTNEIELLQQCLQGHGDSFEVLVGRYQSLVCAITYNATLNLDKSEELAQEAFLLAWKNLRQLRDLSKFRAWLCRIAKTVVLNWLRTRQRDVLTQSASLEDAAGQAVAEAEPAEVAIQKEQEAVVAQAMESIPETYRLPLILFYRENKSTKEVGACIGLTENATRQRIARARHMLKDQVAAMVETTLSQSRPTKAFTATVAASLVGVSMKGAATAAASGSLAAGFSAGVVKMMSLAAGLLVVTGVSLWVYKREPVPASPPLAQVLVADTNEDDSVLVLPQDPTVSTPDVNALQEIKNEGMLASVPVESLASSPDSSEDPAVFQSRGVLSGRITDAVTGEPVRDASVYTYFSRGRRSRTDANGFYRIETVAQPDNYQILIDSNDYVGFDRESKEPIISLSPDQQVVRDFQLSRACKVALRVVDANGVGLPGIRVRCTSLADSPYHLINSHGFRHTDPNGYILLGGFPPALTEYMITATSTGPIFHQSIVGKQDYVEERDIYSPGHTLVRLTDPNVTTQATIVMERGETLHGYAEYRDGKPANNIKIGLQPDWWHCSHRGAEHPVQSDGTFSLAHVVSGIYDIQVSILDEDGMSAYQSEVARKEVSLLDGEPLIVKLPMDSPDVGAAIRGRLYFSGEGHPDYVSIMVCRGRAFVKDLDINLSGMGQDYQGKRFAITGLDEGLYNLRISGGHIRPKDVNGIYAPIDDLELALEFTTTSHITGRVIDGGTKQPITAFQTRTRTLRGNSYAEADRWTSFQDKQGSFDLKLFGPGAYQVQVLAEGYAPTWSQVVDTDEEPNEIVVSLTSGGTVRGYVVNQAGEPIDHAQIIPLSLASDTYKKRTQEFATEKGSIYTEAGVFTLSHVPTGTEAIRVAHPDYCDLVYRDIAVTEGGTTELPDWVLLSGGALEGVVLDPQGFPLANETLCFNDAEKGRTPEPSQRWATAVTDANGYYYVEHLPTRKCCVYRDNSEQAEGVTQRSILPVEGETLRLDFGGAYSVTGVLTMQEGSPAQQRLSMRTPDSKDFECRTQTDDEGRFHFTGVVPGTFRLSRYEVREGTSRWSPVTLVTVIDNDVDLGVVHALNSSNKAIHKLVEITQSSPEPLPRRLKVTFPVQDPMMQWSFYSREDLLAGKLLVRIRRDHQVEEFIVFKDGVLSDGWETTPFPLPNAGEVFFGFQSSFKIATATGDRVEIELHVVKDLEGIGELQTGILPAGIYRAVGTYALLTNEGQVPEAFQAMPEEVVEMMREQMSYLAVTGLWETQWPLEITSEQGWLEGAQREQRLQLNKMMNKAMTKPEQD